MAALSAAVGVEMHTETWTALGTTVVLRYVASARPPHPAVRRAVEAELEAIDLAASRFRPDSELTRLNQAGGARVPVSRRLHDAVALALRAAEITDGAVDPTLGEALVAAGYDRDWRSLTAAPADAPVRADDRIVVRRRPALWSDVQVWQDPPMLRVPRGVRIDLGATAKAQAADRAAEAAHRAGADGVLVSLGGDIATAGTAPEGGWQVHVTDDHRAGPDAPGQTVSIRSGALATSSLVTRRWVTDGTVRHHILDPRDGQPVRTPWRTASVAAATCADANIAATAAIVLGAAAPEWLAGQGLPARLVALDGTPRVQGGWPR